MFIADPITKAFWVLIDQTQVANPFLELSL